MQQEIENLSPEEREKIGWGLSTIGFRVEKMKNDFFAKTFGRIANANMDQRAFRTRFCKELGDSFVRDSAAARQKALEITSAKGKHRLSNANLLFGNIVRYGRVVTDLTGKSLASPLRYVMMGGIATSRIAEAGKEAHLKNEEVIEKTRIEDAEKATEEAWKIYENAQKKEGAENVSAEALKNAYLMEMPKDLQERLQNPSTANTFIQKILKMDIEGAISRLNKSIEKIENNPKLSDEQKEAKKEQLIAKQRKNLEDYDRIITQYGTVDGLAMAGRYAQTASKTVVAAVTVETLVLSVEKLWETLAHTLSSTNTHENAQHLVRGVKNTRTQMINDHPPTHNVGMVSSHTHENIQINPDTIVVHKGEGIEHAFIRQIEHDPKLAKGLGFKGNISDQHALHTFAQHEAHVLAIKEGYADNTGYEIRVMEPNKVAYEIKMENGHPIVNEKMVDGKIIETHHEGDAFGTKEHIQKYEREYLEHHEQIHHINTEKTPAVETQTPPVEKPDTIETLKGKIGAQMDTVQKSETPFGQRTTVTEHRTITDKLPERRNWYQEKGRLELQKHPEFTKNPFHLSEGKLMQVYETNQKNIDFITKQEPNYPWQTLINMKAVTVEHAGLVNQNPELVHLADYLRLLKNFSKLKPKSGFLGLGKETAGAYFARALQKLTAEGKLEQFEDSLRR